MDKMTRRGALGLGVAGIGATILPATAQAQPAAQAFAPLPADARPRPVPPEGYILDRIGDAMYAVTANGTQSAFLVTNTGVVLIDAPPGLADVLPAAIKKVTTKPVTHLIYSHSHADHIANAATFGNVVRIAHADTAALLKATRDPKRPMPTVTFTDRYPLHVGGQHLQLSYPGPNHDAGNILVHAPRQRAAIMIDLVLPAWTPFRAWGTADSVPGVLRAHDLLSKLDIDTYVGGHVHRLGTPRDIRISRDFAYDLWRTTGQAVAAFRLSDFLAKVEAGNNWAGYQLYLNAIADRAVPEIVRRWTGKLAGVDVFTRENIITMALSQALDAPNDIR